MSKYSFSSIKLHSEPTTRVRVSIIRALAMQFVYAGLLFAFGGIAAAHSDGARIVQGEFDSPDDKAAFAKTLAEVTGRDVKFENPLQSSEGSGWFAYSIALHGETAVAGAGGVAYVFKRSGSRWHQQARLAAADSEGIGNSVAVWGDTVAIGANSATTPQGVGAGAAYVFVRTGNTWSQQAKLTAADGDMGENFGIAVALEADTLVIGADQDSNASGETAGAAYVFIRSGTNWTFQTKLTAAGRPQGEAFGRVVALSGESAIVGAPNAAAPQGTLWGAAYVFTRSGSSWTQRVRMTAGASGSQLGKFGASVDIDADAAIVGAPFETNSNGFNAGAAYVFQRVSDNWSFQGKLLANNGTEFDQFGSSVSIKGGFAAVGVPNVQVAGESSAGAVHLYSLANGSWVQRAVLAPFSNVNGGSGSALAMDGTNLAVGSYSDNGFEGSAAMYDYVSGNWTLVEEIFATEDRESDGFGLSVAVSANTVLVGAPTDDAADGGEDTGSAYVFARSGESWVLRQRIRGIPGEQFGASVSISGSYAVIGAPGRNTATGAAYVFEQNGQYWTSNEELFASDGASGDRFGTSVAISDYQVVVGSPKDDTAAGVDAGSAYVFNHVSIDWLEQARLNPSDAAPADQFGHAVAISGDLALIGAPQANLPGASNGGAAYVFQGSGPNWSQSIKLSANDAQAEKLFGSSVAVSGTSAVVGAPESDVVPVAQGGAAYFFSRPSNVWNFDSKVTAADATVGDHFGAAVALSGDRAIVGAPGDDTVVGGDAGSAHLFEHNGLSWNLAGQLTAFDAAAGDQFGSAASLFGDFSVLGAPLDDGPIGLLNFGSAYLRTLGFADGFE